MQQQKVFPCFFPLHNLFLLYYVVYNCMTEKKHTETTARHCTEFYTVYLTTIIQISPSAPSKRAILWDSSFTLC